MEQTDRDIKISTSDPQKIYWLDNPGNIKKIIWGLVLVCTGLTLVDFFYHKHTHFYFEKWFGFFGFYGFIGCVVLVLLAKQMRRLLKRDEEYYDD